MVIFKRASNGIQLSDKTRKVIRLLIFLCLFYQFYDLTNDYLKYINLIIWLNWRSKRVMMLGLLPALTACIDDRNRIKGGDVSYKMICMYKSYLFNYSINCRSPRDYIRQKNNTFCYTFLSSTSYEVSNLNFVTIHIENAFAAKFIWHNRFTSSHFIKQNSYITKSASMLTIQLMKTTARLLPSPYSTNCFDYT